MKSEHFYLYVVFLKKLGLISLMCFLVFQGHRESAKKLAIKKDTEEVSKTKVQELVKCYTIKMLILLEIWENVEGYVTQLIAKYLERNASSEF